MLIKTRVEGTRRPDFLCRRSTNGADTSSASTIQRAGSKKGDHDAKSW
jgi:hypothetical protein